MEASFTEDGNYIIIKCSSRIELDQITYSFKKKERGAFFKEKKFKGYKSTTNFLLNDSKIPVGMWKYLIDECQKFGFSLTFPDLENYFWKIEKDFVEEFCFQLLEKNDKLTPRAFQIDAVYRCFKYRRATAYLSTSAGKTLVIYLLMMLLRYTKKAKKILIITIKPSLSIQMYNEFREFHTIGTPLKVTILHEDFKGDKNDANIYIGNFQTLVNIDPEFFKQFDVVMVDESHRCTASSIKKISSACSNAKAKYGFTGSLKEDNSAEYWSTICYTGPIVKRVTKRNLIDEGHATDGKVEAFKLSYLSRKARIELAELRGTVDGEKLLRIEQQMIRDSEERLNWVCRLINKFDNKNVLVYFNSVKDGYGKKIVEKLKYLTSDKTIFYIDEDVPESQRASFKEEMENSFNNILVATYATWSTGESVKNLHTVVCAEAIKDETTLSQAMGRGMRQHFSKERFLWIDIFDDFSIEYDKNILGRTETETFTNYSIKWSKERRKYYLKEEFECNYHTINLLKE